MRIIHILESVNFGGAEKFTIELATEQSKKNDVVIFSFTPVVEGSGFIVKSSQTLNILSSRYAGKYDPRRIGYLFKILRNFRPDIVHCQSSWSLLFVIPTIYLYKRVRFFYTIHNTLTRGHKKIFNFMSILPGINKRLNFVCLSSTIESIFRKEYPKLNFYTVNNGIRKIEISPDFKKVKDYINQLKGNKDSRVFLTIGNFSTLKNLPVLAGVFKNISEENVILLVAGEDKSEKKEEYKKFRNIMGQNTYLLGLRENIGDFIYNADALIISSLLEGMPLVILEALSAGVPVVSTPAGAIPEMISKGVTGLVSHDFTQISLQEEVLNFLRLSHEEREKMKQNCLEIFETRYSIEKAAERYHELYTSNANE